ncbi:hypothetical protein HON52_02230 [Candidatus Uhrbacteria bacterium]|jgi:hypothetical protein|nr:hypothetical protein [Candidatus Uhrbacteria bacterium]
MTQDPSDAVTLEEAAALLAAVMKRLVGKDGRAWLTTIERLSLADDPQHTEAVSAGTPALSVPNGLTVDDAWARSVIHRSGFDAAIAEWEKAYTQAESLGLPLRIPRNARILHSYLASDHSTRLPKDKPGRKFAVWLVDQIYEATMTGLTRDTYSRRREASVIMFRAAVLVLKVVSEEVEVVTDMPRSTSSADTNWTIQGGIAQKIGSEMRPDESWLQIGILLRPQLKFSDGTSIPGDVA